MKKHRIASLVTALLLMLSVIALPASAAEGEGVASDGYSLTVQFITKEHGEVEGSDFKLYRALDKYGELTGDFAQYADEIEVGDLTQAENVRELANTLAAYAARDLEPIAEGTTDENGQVKFDELERGIYLAVGSTVTVGKYIFTPMAALVEVPQVDENGYLVTDVVINVKYDFVKLLDDINLSVKKVWDDNNYPDRPKSVTVQLLCDGEVYDEIILNEQCEWKHTWTALDPYANWQVTEKDVPQGYSVKITLSDTTYIVTNSFSYENGDKNDTPPGGGSGTTDTNPPPSDPTLPQTGQLWWPVPILFIAGAAIFLLGIIAKNLSYDEKA